MRHPRLAHSRLLFLKALLCWGVPVYASPAASEVSLQTNALGAYSLKGEFRVQADSRTAWDVITDYEGIAKFVSSIRSSRIVRNDPGHIVIEQEGTGRFLFVSRRINLTLEVRETPYSRIDFREIGGARQFKQYEGSWTIARSSGACGVAYELTVQPDPSIGPRFAAKRALKKNAQRVLNEVRSEIQRRGDAH